MKRRCLTAVVLMSLSVVLPGPAGAQTEAPDYSLELRGIEVSPGVIVNGVRYGTSFIGSAAGDLQGTWMVTFRGHCCR